MTNPMPQIAMVLAAGLGKRLRPITATRPKPLVEVAGRTILDRALDALAKAGVGRSVVNTHYLGHMIAGHLAGRKNPALQLSPEDDLLDTGGGVRLALPKLGNDPFFVINGDILWGEGPGASALQRLGADFDETEMDALLLLVPLAWTVGYDGAGDFFLGAGGGLTRRGDQARAPYVFTGLQILHPRLFEECPKGAFSLNVLYDRALESGRLFGLVHTGRWYHIGTPEGLGLAEAALADEGGAP